MKPVQKLKDSGLADVFLGGRGITATVTIVNNQISSKKAQSSLFRVKAVHVKVDALKFSIRDSRHDLLYKTLRPLATGLIKKQVAKAMEDGIRSGFEWADRELGKSRRLFAKDIRAHISFSQSPQQYGRGQTRRWLHPRCHQIRIHHCL
jgi:Protein of unknown function (DUF4449)